MTDWRQRTLESPLAAIDAYRVGEGDIAAVQTAIDVAAGVLESPDRSLSDAMRQAEGELEVIRFTVSEAEQRAVALRILDPLYSRIEAALA